MSSPAPVVTLVLKWETFAVWVELTTWSIWSTQPVAPQSQM